MKRKASKKKAVKKAKRLTMKQQVVALTKLMEEFLARLQMVELRSGIKGDKGEKGERGPKGSGFWGSDG